MNVFSRTTSWHFSSCSESHVYVLKHLLLSVQICIVGSLDWLRECKPMPLCTCRFIFCCCFLFIFQNLSKLEVLQYLGLLIGFLGENKPSLFLECENYS